MSRIIFSREDRVECLQVAHERPDTGIYNAINDMAMVLLRGEMRFATTHGFQSEYSGNNMALYLGFKDMECLRPMTAMGSTSLGPDNPRGRSIAQALDPVVPGRYSRSHAWAFEWHWLAPEGDVPKGGLIAVGGDEKLGQMWWFVHTDGLYRSTDGGERVTKVLEASGRAASVPATGRPSGLLSDHKDLLAFLDCQLVPRLGNAWDYTFAPGNFPPVEWDRPEVVEKMDLVYATDLRSVGLASGRQAAQIRRRSFVNIGKKGRGLGLGPWMGGAASREN